MFEIVVLFVAYVAIGVTVALVRGVSMDQVTYTVHMGTLAAAIVTGLLFFPVAFGIKLAAGEMAQTVEAVRAIVGA